MKVDVNHEDDNLTYEISQEIFHPGDSGEITFQYISSTEGLIEFGETITIEPYPIRKLDLDIIGNVGVGSRANYGLTIGVTVGYRGYEQVQADGYDVQYLESVEVSGDSTNNVSFYIYPEEDVLYDIEGENVTFDEDDVRVFIHDEEEPREIVYDPTEPLGSGYGEVEITVQFDSHHEDDGSIDLVVERDRYSTAVQLTETAPRPGEEEISFVEEEAEAITLGIILVGGVAVYIGGRMWLSKKEKGKEEEGEEKEEEKKEKEEKEED